MSLNYFKHLLALFSILSIMNKIICSDSSSIKLEFREKNHFFTIPIKVGSNSQQFEVQVDTTTSETWLPSMNTTFKVQKYDPSKSSTCEIIPKEFEIDDEDGNVRGTPIYDSITVGPFTLDRFGFVLVQGYQNDFKDFPDGKLGLGFRHEHGVDFNFLGSLKAKGLINKEIFTILPNEEKLVIGGIPSELEGKTYSTCNLVETNDLDDVFRAGWVCELTHIFFGVNTKEKSLEMALQVDARVIFDSAYNYISMPKRHLNDFNKNFMQKFFHDSCIKVKDNEDIYFICDANEKIQQGTIAFLMGGFGYVIPWDKLFKKIEEDKYEMLIRFHKENDDIFSFGYPFTSQFNIVYNAEEKHLGFYGGEKIDLKKDWDAYMVGESPSQKKEKMKKLLIYAGILGGILLFIIICLFIRSNRMKKNNIEQNPIINQEQNNFEN
jgi:hypothetical protein